MAQLLKPRVDSCSVRCGTGRFAGPGWASTASRQLTGLASGGDWIGGRYQKRLEAAMRVAGSGRRLNGTEQRNEDVVHSLEYRLGGLASGQRGLHDPMEAVKEELDAEGRISDA